MFSIVVSCCKSGAIGKNENIIHKIKEDLEFFKNTTLNHTVIVGRKTYESIPNRLPNRKIILITSNKNYKCEIRKDIVIASSFEQAISLTKNETEVFIIGGAQIYKQAVNFIEKLYLTLVLDDCKGDTYFDYSFFKNWNLLSKQNFITSKNLKYKRLVYLKN